jgi:nitrite reductase/ring-hydroxylating ferredoxin subunit
MTVLNDALLASLDDSIVDVAKASTLPAVLYTSPEVLRFELDAVFAHEWLCVGRAERIRNPGDWFTTMFGDEPIVVTRDKSGTINALSAVCRHRAMQVCDGAGNSTTLKCPYHHWNYSLDGRLLGAPAMERTAAFEKSEWGLPRLQVEEWHGFLFVNIDGEAAPLTPSLQRYEPYVANYDLDAAVCPGTFTLTALPWNWKVMFENFNDGYHANRLHQYVQDFCPSSMTAFPVPWERHLPHRRIHPPRWRLQRHPPGDHAGVPEAHRGGALALDVRPRAPDTVLRHRSGPVLLLPGAPDRATDDRRRDRLPLPPVGARGPAVRAQAATLRRRGAGVRAPGPGRHDEGAARAALEVRATGPVLVAGGEPRAVQPLAGAALPSTLADRADDIVR